MFAAAAAHMVGVPWVTQGQGATVKELRAAIGITRERLEAAYDHLLKNPVLGLAVVAALAMMELPLETTAPITPPASIEPASSEPTTAVRSRGMVTS